MIKLPLLFFVEDVSDISHKLRHLGFKDDAQTIEYVTIFLIDHFKYHLADDLGESEEFNEWFRVRIKRKRGWFL